MIYFIFLINRLKNWIFLLKLFEDLVRNKIFILEKLKPFDSNNIEY
jgi:hypothetical protein